MTPPSAFDIRGPLPTGTTLLEASAGTGKTWTIGALVTRFVAEGHARLEQMIVYAQTALCRTRLLLSALGEEPAWENCGTCDNCRNPLEAQIGQSA